MEKSKGTLKGKLFPLFLLAAASGMWNLLYVIQVFYVPYQKVFGYTNLQMGLLLTIYSVIGTPGSLIGGALADMWSPKKILVGSCIVSACCGYALCTIPPFSVAVVIYAIMSIPMGWLAWTPFNKCIAVMAIDGDEGRLYGLASTFDCILTMCLTLGLTALFGNGIAEVGNFRLLLIIMSSVYLGAGLLLHFVYDYDSWAAKAGIDVSKKKFKLDLSGYKATIKTPVPWVCGLLVMGMYIAATGLNYLSPYLNAVYVMPVGLASAFGIIVRYGCKSIFNPLGGWFRDTKLGGSTPKLVWTSTILVFISAGILFVLPKTENMVYTATIVALILMCVFRLNSSSEATTFRVLKKIPMSMLGSMMGLGFMIAYSTDMWLPSLVGNILDKNGNAGYNFVFLIVFLGMALASVCAYILYRLSKKEEQEEAAVNA